MSEAQRVKVKRDGPRGWHWIAAHSYDPARHEVVDDAATETPALPAQNTTPSTPAATRNTKPGRRVGKQE